MIFAILEAALRALVVASIVGCGLRLLRVRSVPAEKVAWGLVLAAALAMPGLMHLSFLPILPAIRIPARLVHQAPAPVALAKLAPSVRTFADAREDVPVRDMEAGAPGSGRFPAPVISETEFSGTTGVSQDASNVAFRDIFFNKIRDWQSASTGAKLESIAGALYAAVAIALLARMVMGFVACLWLWQTARPVRLSREEGGSPLLRIRESGSVSSPVTVGSGILLPESWVEWDVEKLRIVLAHEDAHVRQGDFYLQTLAGVYTALFWFSPLGWWLKRKLSDLGEAISDRAGLEMAASPFSYAQILLEFAAAPRPSTIGVAMARSTNLSHRVERFLNETSFHQAFAGGHRRVLAAVLVVPAALLAGTTLVRVQAQSEPPTPPTPVIAPSPVAAPPAPAVVEEPASAADASQDAPPDPGHAGPVPPAPAAPVAPPAAVPVPPTPAVDRTMSMSSGDGHSMSMSSGSGTSYAYQSASSGGNSASYSSGNGPGYSYSYSSNGDSWALVTDGSQRVTFNGDWHDSTREEVEKARKLSNGKFLWFTHDGKSYFIDDPATIAQIETMYKPIEELGHQQEELGRKQEELGRQQEELGRKQEEASIPTPDISKEMAQLNEAVAKLNAKKGSTVNQEELADLEGKLGDLQGRLGALQGEVGAKQGELGAKQGELGRLQGELGAQQGRLGAEQGRLSQQADRKVKTIIDESLRDGKAKPVQ